MSLRERGEFADARLPAAWRFAVPALVQTAANAASSGPSAGRVTVRQRAAA